MKSVLKSMLIAAAVSAISMGAVAQSTPVVDQRQDNQQQRIGQGVENGSLTAREATRLERKETRLNVEEKRMKADGNMTPAERARLQRQQNALSKGIYRQKHDAQVQNVNPKSEIGMRQREQQKRIGEGIQNGSLNAREAARMEHQETRLNREVARDRRDGGGMTAGERAKINRQQNRQSKRIYRQKHDGQVRH